MSGRSGSAAAVVRPRRRGASMDSGFADLTGPAVAVASAAAADAADRTGYPSAADVR